MLVVSFLRSNRWLELCKTCDLKQFDGVWFDFKLVDVKVYCLNNRVEMTVYCLYDNFQFYLTHFSFLRL